MFLRIVLEFLSRDYATYRARYCYGKSSVCLSARPSICPWR